MCSGAVYHGNGADGVHTYRSSGARPPAGDPAGAESRTSLVRRARKINRVLGQTYPDARCELDFHNPFELLVVTVLSAQTTDKRVNAVRPTLFAAYPDARAMAAAEREKLEAIIGPLGFFRAKTESLLKLERGPGRAVRRRGAAAGSRTWSSCPASAARPRTSCWATRSASPAITVDTHFGRLSRRFGWTDETDPVKVEHAVGRLFPKKDWVMLSHHLIWHGRRCCHAQKPACGACPVARWCPSYGEGPTDPETAAKLLRTEGRA